ncbi:MAG: polyphosphate polymerase domain-containing protein [Elusimicrobia bacterium]|nr:polyphosphate polymerase domain-containing protein [Elusimicrobiota bacterium]
MTSDLINKKKIQYRFQRFEFKYYLSRRNIDAMYNILLNNHMVPDPFLSEKDYYMVSSLYFDSPTLKCYNEKISGIKHRAKLRLRTYDENFDYYENVFLEIKRKADAVIIKDRAKIDAGLYYKSLNGAFQEEDLGNKTIEEFFMRQRAYSMVPLVLVKYKRKPLVSKFDDNLRITFDYDLEAGQADSFSSHQTINPIFPAESVMEVKYNNSLPSWIHRIIQKYELSRQAVSKYCYGIDTIKQHHQLKF